MPFIDQPDPARVLHERYPELHAVLLHGGWVAKQGMLLLDREIYEALPQGLRVMANRWVDDCGLSGALADDILDRWEPGPADEMAKKYVPTSRKVFDAIRAHAMKGKA